MKIKQDITLQQRLELKLTPELVITLNLLQLPIIELELMVQEELERNPFLESKNVREEPLFDEKIAELDRISEEQIKFSAFKRSLRDTGAGEGFPLENIPEEGKSLYLHLLEQISVINLTEEERIIARTLLGFIDERGFLTASEDEIAQQLEIEAEKVKKVLDVMKREIEPTGLVASSIEERLLLQAIERNADEIVKEIIKNYLPAIEKGKKERVMKELNISPDEFERALRFIRTLDPKPERIFYSKTDNRDIIPDARVVIEDGEVNVEINDDGIPELTVNTDLYRLYREELRKNNKDAVKAIEMLYNRAKSFYRIKEERRRNLERIIREIVTHNIDFFLEKSNSLKPLTMKEIANRLQITEGTVSRIVSGKFIDTPRGIFELKRFFTKRLKTVDGREVSADYVKKRIRELIASEDRRKPLSDQEISDILRKEGIWVARRTVGKYREEMGILDSKRR